MSTPTKITASGVPLAPEGRETQTPETNENEARIAALFKRLQALNDNQFRTYGACMFGSVEAFVCYDWCNPTPERLTDAVERAIVNAEANKT